MKIFLFLSILLWNTNQNTDFDIHKIHIFDTKVWHEVNYLSSSKHIEVDSLDILKIKSILNKAKTKKNLIYKPGSNSLLGLIKSDNKEAYIRISQDIIFLSFEDRKHFIIKDKQDRKWLNDFINKYRAILSKISK